MASLNNSSLRNTPSSGASEPPRSSMIHDKVDLCLWTKNGERTLNAVLTQIEKVIPRININQKIIIDDSSSDSTRTIAKLHGWQVYMNTWGGISNGANAALSHVETEYFCSFEQDVILASDWWRKISPLIHKPGVAAASGIRYPSGPPGITAVFRYSANNYDKGAFTLGKTLDNTIYRTSVLRTIGGFPKLKINAGIDLALSYKLEEEKWKWITDLSVESIHLRFGLMDEIRHQESYGSQTPEIYRLMGKRFSIRNQLLRVFRCPVGSFYIIAKTHEPSVLYVFPLIRIYFLKGIAQSHVVTRT